MANFLKLFAVVALSGAATAAAGALVWMGEGSLAARARRLVFHGAPLIEVKFPHTGQQVDKGGIEVLVSFPDGERVAVNSFRCLLNDHDVTALLTVGQNGAGGSIFGLVEGENQLRIEIFGSSWWGSRYFQDSRVVTFRVSPMPNLDRARGPATGRVT